MPDGKNIRVLVVDDQPGVRYLLETIIGELGFGVDTAQNGIEAIDKVSTSRPDIIFLDVHMPLMGGIEALAKIRKLAPDIDVVLMTAYGSDDTIQQGSGQGSFCCLAKPFDVEKVKNFLLNYAQGVFALD